MTRDEFSILERSKNKKGYITLVNNSNGEELDVYSKTAELYLREGTLRPRIVLPEIIHRSEQYIISFESVLGGTTYYKGFNLLFDCNIGITSDIKEAKIFESFDKSLSKATKLARKSDMLFIYLKELNEVLK